MFKIALKGVLARKGRILLTSIAIIAGTAFLSGVFVFSDTIRASIDRLFATAYENVDVFARSSNVLEGDFGAESRDRLPSSLIDTIGAVPGVAEVAGDVQSFARITNPDGDEVGGGGPPTYGGVFTDVGTSPWGIDEGRAARTATEVVVDRATAKLGKIDIGDTITVTTTVGARPFEVVGIVTFGDADGSGGATWALFTLEVAEEFVVGRPGFVDSIQARGDGSLTEEELAASVREALAGAEGADSVEVLTGQQIIDETQTALQEGFQFFTIFLTIFALIALFVGSFIIYNVFKISAAQRQKEHALMRAIGASRGQITRVVFTEAAVVGLVGSLLGFAGGVALAATINKVLEALGFGPGDSSLVVKPTAFVITLVVGMVVTLSCAIVPAVRAGRVPPLAAMRDVSIDRSGHSRRRIIVGIVFMVIAIASIAAGLNGELVMLGVGTVALFIGLIALGPVVVGPSARLATPVMAKLRGVEGSIAGRNAARGPERTALTAGALGIGLALVVAVSTLGASVKDSIRNSIGAQFTGDYTITSDSQGFGGLPISLADELNALPEVGAAVGIGGNLLQLVEDGEPKTKSVLTVDPVAANGVFDLAFTDGGWDQLDPDGILVATDKAERDGLTVGDRVDAVLLDQTRRTLTVAGVFDSDDFGNLIVDRQLFTGTQTDVFDALVLINRAEGVSDEDAAAAIAAVAERYPSGKLQTREEFIDSQASQVDGFLNFIYALLGMSIFIAVLGIVITLLLAVYERRRELGLVRAVGMTRGQVRSSIRWEAMLTALIGAAMGTGLGVVLGWVVVRALRDQGLTSFALSPVTIVVATVLAVVLALLAAWFPARKAAKADILDAIATT
jgi:putative ABC transport system permease protein